MVQNNCLFYLRIPFSFGTGFELSIKSNPILLNPNTHDHHLQEVTMTTEPPITDQGSTHSKEDVNINNNASKPGGIRSGARKSLPSPLTSARSNAAADNRNMRRIIAEDPEWSLATVPLLTELSVTHIVNNFAGTFEGCAQYL